MKTITPAEKKDKTILNAFDNVESAYRIGVNPTYAIFCEVYTMIESLLEERLKPPTISEGEGE